MNDFWINFSANLSATLLAALIIYLVGLSLGFFVSNKPKLVMVVKQNGFYGDTIILSKQDDGSYVGDFQFAIKNEGKLTLKANEGFWHTYILTENTTPVSAQGETNHQRGVISYSIYPNYIVDIDGPVYHFVLKKDDIQSEGIRYFFATDYGLFPESSNFNSKTGRVDMSTLGLIKFELR